MIKKDSSCSKDDPMGQKNKYLMESEEEAHRLDVKTDTSAVEKQARWAGIS